MLQATSRARAAYLAGMLAIMSLMGLVAFGGSAVKPTKDHSVLAAAKPHR